MNPHRGAGQGEGVAARERAQEGRGYPEYVQNFEDSVRAYKKS